MMLKAIELRDDLYQRLLEISARENRSLDQVVESMLTQYLAGQAESDVKHPNGTDPLEAFIGAFNDDIPNMLTIAM